MIAIVSSNARERSALGALCEQHSWPHATCDSIRAFKKLVLQILPGIVVTRHKLSDGYSDDIFAAIGRARTKSTRVIVLYSADLSAAATTRQIAIGAECVLRDPVRTDLLLAYLTRYLASPARTRSRPPVAKPFHFAGALIDPVARTMRREDKQVALSPREVELVQLLHAAGETMISYQDLYNEILGRPFRGDTSNMRVLLGKLDTSFRALGIRMRDHVSVIPKAGYRCVRNHLAALPRTRPRSPGQSRAA